MRKAAAILLLALLAFNWCGYRFVFSYMQFKANKQLESKLDSEEYDASRLVELRIPLHMPYQSNRTDFERIDGEVELDGVHYKYVKRKVVDGYLILLCLPNEQKMRIESAKIDVVKYGGDFQTIPTNKGSGKSDASLSIKSIIADYILIKNNWYDTSIGQNSIIYQSFHSNLPGLLYNDVAERPPNC